MLLWNLYILHKIKPLWLRKSIANIFGFLLLYPIVLHNKETALLLSIFLATYLYRNMQSIDTHTTQDSKTSNNEVATQPIIHEFAIIHFMMSCFCACLFIFTTWQAYVIQALCGCIFLRIYDYYKPSLIGRFYAMQPNKILGSILGAILHGILSGASTALLHFLCLQFPQYCSLPFL